MATLTFKVFFKGQSGNGSAVQMDGRKLAPVEVGDLCNKYKHRMNIAEYINRDINPLNSSVSLVFTAEQAASIPALNDQLDGNLKVTVPDAYLNQYIEKEVYKNDANQYGVKYTVNETALYKAWKDAGYPTKFGFEKELNPVKEMEFVGATTISQDDSALSEA